MEDSYRRIWDEIGAGIRPHVSADAVQRWFATIDLVDADELALTFEVPNTIYQLWIESNYLNLVEAAALAVLGSPRQIKFRVSENGNLGRVPDPKVEPSDSQIQAKIQEKETEPASNHGMNPRNSFETFVVGANNQFAHAAALAVAQSPAKTYNPLFIYGGVGLGKTHLMQAIGQQVMDRKKNFKVMYLSSEKFTNEFIDAIQHNTLVKFRKRYRQADLLLIDDIHFLAGKERSQEEFFHTFNTLFDGRKQILNVQLSQEILEFLAQRVRTNVRRLEGALMRVASFVSLSGREISRETVEQRWRDILQEEAKKIVTIDQIQKKAAEHFDVRLADMTSKRRPANIAFPRKIAMYLARRHTKSSLNEIGDAFGGRDHGTVLHAFKAVTARMKKEDQVRQLILLLDTQLER